jgi:hypothetical protein
MVILIFVNICQLIQKFILWDKKEHTDLINLMSIFKNIMLALAYVNISASA